MFTGKFQHRKATLWNRIVEDPNDRTTNPGYLFGSFGGFTADEQANVDQEILASIGTIDGWMFINYLIEDLLQGQDAQDTPDHPFTTEVVKLNNALYKFRTSPYRNRMKYCMMVIAAANYRYGLNYPLDDPWKYNAQNAQRIGTYFSDPNYLRIDGRPVIVVYAETVGLIDLANWTTFLANLPETPFRINAHVDGDTAALGLNAQYRYGRNNLPVGVGQLFASAQAARDRSTWTAATARKLITGVTVSNDARMFLPSQPYTEQYTQVQWVNHVYDAYNRGYNYMIPVSNWNEVQEQGYGLYQNEQEAGSPSQSGNRYLEGIRWVKAGAYPTRFTYEMSCCNLPEAITDGGSGVLRSGGWTVNWPDPVGVPGAHDSDDIRSAIANNVIGIEHPCLCVGGFYVTTGPDLGIAIFSADGVDVAEFDCYSPTEVAHVLAWTYDFGDDGKAHTIRIKVKGTKNPLSSSVQIAPDSFYLEYNPRSARPG